MKPSELQFKPVDGLHDQFACNVCGHEGPGTSWRMADVPVHGGRNTFSVVVCSRKCQRAYQHHPSAQKHLADGIARVEAMPAPEPTPEEIEGFASILRKAAANIGLELGDVQVGPMPAQKGGDSWPS